MNVNNMLIKSLPIQNHSRCSVFLETNKDWGDKLPWVMVCFNNDRFAKEVRYFILYCGTLLREKFRRYFRTRLNGYRLKIDVCATNHIQYFRMASNFLPVLRKFPNPTTLKSSNLLNKMLFKRRQKRHKFAYLQAIQCVQYLGVSYFLFAPFRGLCWLALLLAVHRG